MKNLLLAFRARTGATYATAVHECPTLRLLNLKEKKSLDRWNRPNQVFIFRCARTCGKSEESWALYIEPVIGGGSPVNVAEELKFCPYCGMKLEGI
jgi:hypothetical protein